MWTEFASWQSDVANAVLDAVPVSLVWTVALVHAEFPEELREPVGPQVEAILVLANPDRSRPHPVTLGAEVVRALSGLHQAYRTAGEGFHRVDLTLQANDGSYHFEFDRRPSLVCAGKPDPEWKAKLHARYQAQLPAAPAPPKAASPQRAVVLHATTRANLERAIEEAARAMTFYASCAAPAVAAQRPGVARLFRALAASKARLVSFFSRILSSVPPPSTPSAPAAGLTKDHLAAALATEQRQAEVFFPHLFEASAVETNAKLRDVFVFGELVARGNAEVIELALKRHAAGSDLDVTAAMYVCGLCGGLEFSTGMPCLVCQTSSFTEVR